MDLSAIVALLTSATMLLSLAQASPQLPQSFRDKAIAVANDAIREATNALSAGKVIKETASTARPAEQTSATAANTSQSNNSNTLQSNTTPPPPPPAAVPPPPAPSRVEKAIHIAAGPCNASSLTGTACPIEVWYLENGERAAADAVTLSADDSAGKITAPDLYTNGVMRGPAKEGNPVTINTISSTLDGKPTAIFSYWPSGDHAETYTFSYGEPPDVGSRITRTVTAIVNGVSATQTIYTRYYPRPVSQ